MPIFFKSFRDKKNIDIIFYALNLGAFYLSPLKSGLHIATEQITEGRQGPCHLQRVA